VSHEQDINSTEYQFDIIYNRNSSSPCSSLQTIPLANQSSVSFTDKFSIMPGKVSSLNINPDIPPTTLKRAREK
jgi:hypothetical protein